MPVYQEELYFVTEEFDEDEVSLAKEFLNHNLPVCSEVDWFRNEVTITGFDNRYGAQDFSEKLRDYVDNQ